MFVVPKTFFVGVVLAFFIFSINADKGGTADEDKGGSVDPGLMKNNEDTEKINVIDNSKINSTSSSFRFSPLDEGNDKPLITRFAASQVNSGLKITELPQIDLRYHTLPKRCVKNHLPADCGEATACTQRSGIYQLGVYNSPAIYAPCDATTEDGGWTVIQSRRDGTENFYRNWADYENGFGNLNGDFFIGLKNLYTLTNTLGPQELLIVMESPDLVLQYAKYDTFVIGNAQQNYALQRLGTFSGTARDSLRIHEGMPFTTKDRNNGPNKPDNCAQIFTGAWWYINCMNSNLNGVYGKQSGNGVYWHGTVDNSNQKYVKMMIRRRRY